MRLYVDGFVQVALYILTALLSPKNIKELHRQLRQTEQSIIFPILCLMTVLNELGDSDRPKLDLALSHLLREHFYRRNDFDLLDTDLAFSVGETDKDCVLMYLPLDYE